MKKLFLSTVMTFVAFAELATGTCVVWIFGQEDMPDDLIS